MSTVSFFTPICYEYPKTFREYVQEEVENYFYLGGKRAYVISRKREDGSQSVVIRSQQQNKIARVIIGAVKIASYATIVLPLLALVAKVAFRAVNKFHLISSNTNSEKGQVAKLMEQFTAAWNDTTKSFDFPSDSFKCDRFVLHLAEHTKRFQKEGVNNEQHFGYIDKFDLDLSKNPRIYMRADLHGDLKSLVENIRSLQQEGLLDENFKCKQGVHLVFLGDYCDRGIYGTQILEMLMWLREENPEFVHLVRGNHEDVESNLAFGATDLNLMSVLKSEEATNALQRFYETMSLTTYFSVSQGSEGEKRDYIQCTHGLFELTMDPSPLLDTQDPKACLVVPKKRELSERVKKIADSDLALSQAAKRIQQLVVESRHIEEELTLYNWGDANQDYTRTYYLSDRSYSLSVADIQHYLDLSSDQHRVMMLFRGHEHAFQHLMHEDKLLVTTLPVGMDCPAYSNRFTQPDRAYIITPSKEMQNWRKRAILREKGQNTAFVTSSECALTSSEI